MFFKYLLNLTLYFRFWFSTTILGPKKLIIYFLDCRNCKSRNSVVDDCCCFDDRVDPANPLIHIILNLSIITIIKFKASSLNSKEHSFLKNLQ